MVIVVTDSHRIPASTKDMDIANKQLRTESTCTSSILFQQNTINLPYPCALLMWVTHADNLFRSKHSGLEYLCYSRTIPFANYLGAIISRFNAAMPENNTKLIQIGDVDDIGFTTTYQLSSKYHQQC